MQRHTTYDTRHGLLRKIIAVLCATVMMTNSLGAKVEAAADATSTEYGYSVDNSVYKPVVWYNHSYMYTSYAGKKVGYTRVDWGVTRAKQKSNGQYTDVILTRSIMMGNGSDNTYGYSDRLVVSSFLNSGQTLLASNPKNTPKSKSYTIGLSAEGGKDGAVLGISATKTYVKNVLEVINETNWPDYRPSVRFEYYHDTFVWDNTFDTYCFGNNE